MSFRTHFMPRASLFVLAAAVPFASDVARAQTTSSGGTVSGGPTISASLPNPYRALFQSGSFVDVTNSPRAQNLNPTGANYSDCEQDLQLNFPLVVTSPFVGGMSPRSVGGTGGLLGGHGARGVGQVPTCWRVGPAGHQGYSTSPTSFPTDVFVRDVLRYENSALSASGVPPFDATFSNPTNPAGEAACHVQSSDASVTLNIWFIPVTIGSNTATGTAFEFQLATDLVAPPPPTLALNASGVPALGVGQTLLQVTWVSPGDDPDIAGFAVWSDPPAGGTGTSGCGCGSAPGATSASDIVDAAEAAPVTPVVPFDASRLICSITPDFDGPLEAP